MIIDDIIDNAGTLRKATEYLTSHGAASVEAYIIHPVLSRGAVEMVETSELKCVHVTNTIIHSKILLKFSLNHIDNIIITALKGLVQGT